MKMSRMKIAIRWPAPTVLRVWRFLRRLGSADEFLPLFFLRTSYCYSIIHTICMKAAKVNTSRVEVTDQNHGIVICLFFDAW